MYKEIIIVRHLRTLHNIGVDHGEDSDITEHAKDNCGSLLGSFLQHRLYAKKWHIYTSPFLRCLRTTKFIQDILESRCQVEPLCGEYLTPETGKASIPRRDQEFNSFDWSNYPSGPQEFCPQNNEDFMLRIRRLYQKLPKESIVVTHGLPAFLLMNVAANPQIVNVPMWDWSLDNGSVTWIKDGRIIFRGLNLYWEEGRYPNNATRDRYDLI